MINLKKPKFARKKGAPGIKATRPNEIWQARKQALCGYASDDLIWTKLAGSPSGSRWHRRLTFSNSDSYIEAQLFPRLDKREMVPLFFAPLFRRNQTLICKKTHPNVILFYTQKFWYIF